MRSLYKRTHSALAWIWAAFVLLMLFLLVFVQEQSDYKHKLEISLQNGVLFALGFALLGGISAWYVRVRDRVHAAIARLPRCTPLLLASALFLLQAWVFYHTYFIPGWDAGNVLAAAQSVAVYGEAPLYENYFSTYPNNLLLVRLYAALFDLFAWLGSSHHNLYFTILIQCFGSAVAGLCLFSVVKKLTCPLYAYAAWTVYALHIALNPWICIL